jgi:RNA polymerase-interacting CarD/CdnL/TRCF family regulator
MLDTAKNLLVKELSLVNNTDADEIEAQLLALLEPPSYPPLPAS